MPPRLPRTSAGEKGPPIRAANAPSILIIGPVWPEPRSSAAGLRSRCLIRAFRDAGWEVSFASTAKEDAHSEALRAEGVPIRRVAPNDPSFDSWVAELAPGFVLFERFTIEEQFGWRVREASPGSVRVLDTVDLHFVRRARGRAVRSGAPETPDLWPGEDAFREMASIYRCDLSLLISDFEMGLLCDPRGPFRVPAAQVRELSFCYDPPPPPVPDSERSGFAVIGNFRHEPNADGVRWLHREIWPRIRARLPGAEVHVYGAYPPREIMDLTDRAAGFYVRGPAPDQYERLGRHLVNLAPLRFGAGLKGKISDGWWCGTPCVTTPVGAEGMRHDGEFGGAVVAAGDAQAFAEEACLLHEEAPLRDRAREAGYRILAAKFDHARNAARLIAQLLEVRSGLDEARRLNFVGNMLSHHLHQSTKYFSRWIELKEWSLACNPGKAWHPQATTPPGAPSLPSPSS